MTEELLDQKGETDDSQTVVDDNIVTEPTVDKIETLAREMGWVDKDNYHGEPDEWVDAKQFVKDAVVINKKQRNIISKMSDEITSLREDFKTTIKHIRSNAERDIKEAKERLELEKEQAILDADPVKVKTIDEKIKNLDESDEEIETKTPIIDPVFKKWQTKNDWYGNDKRMTRYADAIAYEHENSGKTMQEILEIVDEEMEFYKKPPDAPTKTSKSRSNVSDVIDNTHNLKTQPQKYTYDKLPKEAKEVCDRLVKRKEMTKDEYTTMYFEKVEG